MGIKFACPLCNKPLNVKDAFAGKRGYCPECKGKILIPPVSGPGNQPPQEFPGPDSTPTQSVTVSTSGDFSAVPDVPMASTVDSPIQSAQQNSYDAIDESPDSVWYVRPRIGGQFGPASGDLMRRWLGEGRVSHDSLIWRDGWADWLEAGRVFPHLHPATPQAVPNTGSGDFAISPSVTKSAAYKHHRKTQKNRMLALLIIGSIVAGILVIVLFLVL